MTEDYSYDRQPTFGDPARSRDRHGDPLHWNDLSRPARNALSRLLGGGTLRGVAPEIIADLRRMGLIEGNDRSAQLSRAGWNVLRRSRERLRAVAAD
jgi:hypothetical protein